MAQSWLKHICGRRSRHRKKKRYPLRLETLERRQVLTASVPAAEWFVSERDVLIGQWTGRSTALTSSLSDTLATDTAAPASVRYGPQRHVFSDWIVQLSPQAASQVADLASIDRWWQVDGVSLRTLRGLGQSGLVQVQALTDDEAAVENYLGHHAQVMAFQRNVVVTTASLPDDPEFFNQIGLENIGQFNSLLDADIDAPLAWDVTTGSYSTVVSVIDSGIDATHPDLANNIWINQGEIPDRLRIDVQDVDDDGLISFFDLNAVANSPWVRDTNSNGFIDAVDLLNDANWADGIDTDRNGFIDDFFGWNFRTGSDEPYAPNNPSDSLGHGTHVAGIIGAVGNNARGVAGVNWRVSLMALKFLDQNNQGDLAAAIASVNYATMMRSQFDTNVRVINASWGQAGSSNDQLSEAIQAAGQAGILMVAAAGNGNVLGVGVDNDRTPFFPANYPQENILSVAASNGQDQLATFSNYGVTSVDIAAPGVGILSTLPGGRYGQANGTSMATPMVSGVAALVWSSLPQASVAEVRQAILSSSDRPNSIANTFITGGRLNARAALDANVFAPVATLQQAKNVTAAGGTTHEIVVSYFDRNGIDTTTIGDDDITIIRRWGPVQEFVAQLQPGSLRTSADGLSVTATYLLVPPGGNWDVLDFGGYAIQTIAGSVASRQPASALSPLKTIRQEVIGQFSVRINDPHVLIVDSMHDSSSSGAAALSLREAIAVANADPRTAYVILLDNGRYTLEIPAQPDPAFEFFQPSIASACGQSSPSVGWSNASTGDLDILGNVTLIGNRASTSIIDAQSLDRVFKVHSGARLQLERVTITGGRAPVGQSGGAILSAGNVQLVGVTLQGNATHSSADQTTRGGAIAAWSGVLDVTSSRITENQSDIGGGIFWCGQTTVEIDKSTIDANRNGALVSYADRDALVDSSTIAVNFGDAIQSRARDFSGGTGNSSSPTISRDGRSIAFMSEASNLVSSDTNTAADVFVFDTTTGSIRRLSLSTQGEQALAASEAPTLSGDGRKAAFLSTAGNLVAGDNSVTKDIFVRDLTTGNTQLVSQATSSARASRGWSALSDDARYVVYQQSVSDDPANTWGLFVADLVASTTARVSLALGDAPARIGLLNASVISGDGRTIAIASLASGTSEGNHHPIYMVDRTTGQVSLLPVRGAGAAANGSLYDPAISFDGNLITFASDDSQLVTGDSNGVGDLFVFDRATGSLELISRNSAGQAANGASSNPAISSDGRFIAYASIANDLVTDDTNDQSDIFVFDRTTNTTERISLALNGGAANGASANPSISGDGRYVTYESTASNLVSSHASHAARAGSSRQIFLFDRLTRQTRPVSAFEQASQIRVTNSTLAFNTGSATVAGNVASNNSLYAGNLVEFDLGRQSTSEGYNLFASSHSSVSLVNSDRVAAGAAQSLGPLQSIDEFLPPGYPLIAGSPAIDNGSPTSSGSTDQWNRVRTQPDVGALEAVTGSVSGSVFADLNGNRAQDAGEPNLPDIRLFVDANRDGVLQSNERSQFSSRGIQSSSLGSYQFSDLLPGSQTVRAMVPDQWEAAGVGNVRVGLGTTQGNGASSQALTSPSGRWVALVSSATNLVAADNATPNVFIAARDPATGATLAIEKIPIEGANLRVEAFAGLNEQWILLRTDTAVYLYDRVAQSTEIISVSATGQLGNAHSDNAAASADGRWIVFSSFSNNLVPGDSDDFADLFLVDRSAGRIESITLAALGYRGNDDCENPSISSDGRTIVFTSDASNLVQGDTNGLGDLFEYDVVGRTIRRINVAASGTQSNGFTYPPSISGNGRYVLFQSMASNLVSGDTNGASDLFVYDRQLSRLELLNIPFIAQAQAIQLSPAISHDGQYVVFEATGSLLALPEATSFKNIFVFDRSWSADSGPVSPLALISRADNFETANGDSTRAKISGDGRTIAFESRASNLVVGDTNQGSDVFTRSNPFENASQTVTLTIGQQLVAMPIGLVPKPGSISGTLFNDQSGDEVYDLGDPGLAGWTVYIDANLNGRRDVGESTTLSQASGRYQFSNIATYRRLAIGVEIPLGWEQVAPKVGSSAVQLFMPAAGMITGRDFALRERATTGQSENARIEGKVFRDLNLDGTQQSNEPNLAGIELYLDLNADEVRGFDEPRSLTDAQGNYSFSSLGNRNYTVRATLPEGNSLTSPVGNRFATVTQNIFSTSLSLSKPQDVVIDDFDGINGPDMAVALISGNAIVLQLNDGRGGFQSAPITISTAPQGLGPLALASAQLNGRGAADLVVANSLNSSLSLFLDFNGTQFAQTSTLTLDATPSDVTLADVDSDGDLDIVVATQSSTPSNLFVGRLKLLLNNGAGQFSAAASLDTGGKRATSVVAADLNRDGQIDLAVANQGNFGVGGDTGNIAVLLGRGGGQFASAVVTLVGATPMSIDVGDFDADTFMDLVAVNFDVNTASILRGDGIGHFASVTTNLAVGQGPVQVEVADMDGDRDVDILVSNLKSKSVSILRNKQSQSSPSGGGGIVFEPADSFGVFQFATGPRLSFALGDVDGSGSLDMAIVNSESNSLRLLSNSVIGGAHRIQAVGAGTSSGQNFAVRADVLLPAVDAITAPATILEDVGLVGINLSGIASGYRSSVSVQLSATSSDVSVVPQPTIIMSPGATTARLEWTQTGHANGPATITIELRNAGADGVLGNSDDGVITRSHSLSVIAVNDPPQVNLRGNQVITIGSAQRVVPQFATGFAPGGGADEVTQTVAEYVVSNDRTDLFVVQPAIDNEGRLRFQPGLVRTGVATISVQVRDSGGTLNGGNDRSLVKTFQISVIDLADGDIDFGDAPTVAGSQRTADYPTLLASDGARHRLSALTLGPAVDAEPNGQPESSGLGDDQNLDDEDGIEFVVTPWASASVPTLASLVADASTAGRLDGWIDFNQDGDWNDTGEQILTSTQLVSGSNLLSYTVPAGARPGVTYGRFRISSSGGLSPKGLADDGEVEDHAVTIIDGQFRNDVSIHASKVGQHDILMLDGQLLVRAAGTTIFAAPGSNVDRVQSTDSSGQPIVQITRPAENLTGVVQLAAEGKPTKLLINAASPAMTRIPSGALSGISVVEVANVDRGLQFTSAEIVSLNAGRSVRIVTAFGSSLKTSGAWELANRFVDPSAGQAQIVHRFTQSGATLELQSVYAWNNAINPFDTNGDGAVSPIDALLIINYLNQNASRLPAGQLPVFDSQNPRSTAMVDVNANNISEPLDALLLINFLNGGSEPLQASSQFIASASHSYSTDSHAAE